MEPGRVIEGRYVVERPLATGGMATVWVVRHRELDSLHALKILHLPSPDIRERLLLEGRVQAKLRHPNLVAVTDTLTVDGNPGLVMEYVEGPSLEAWLHTHQATPRQVEDLFLGILAGVDHAHASGVVHRDLKPANVLLAPLSGGVLPKVADFGIAKVVDDVLEARGVGRASTRSGVMMGTPAYMAPEQGESAARVGPPADVFALGCILYDLALGRPAFDGPHVGAILTRILKEDYPDPAAVDPSLAPGVIAAIRGALRADPEQRIATCGELARVLTEGRVTTLSGQGERPVEAPVSAPTVVAPPSSPDPTPAGPRQASRSTLIAGLAMGGLVLLSVLALGAAAVGLGVWWWMDGPGANPPQAMPEPAVPDPTVSLPAAPVPTAPVPGEGTAPDEPSPAPVPESAPPAPTVAPVPAPVRPPAPVVVAPAPAPGAAAPEGDWRVRIDEVRVAASTHKGSVLRYQASPGRQLLLVDVTVTYRGEEAVEPTAPWRLLAGAEVHEVSARCAVAVPDALSSLERYEVGTDRSGTLCFEVPEGVQHGELRFATGLAGGATVHRTF